MFKAVDGLMSSEYSPTAAPCISRREGGRQQVGKRGVGLR